MNPAKLRILIFSHDEKTIVAMFLQIKAPTTVADEYEIPKFKSTSRLSATPLFFIDLI